MREVKYEPQDILIRFPPPQESFLSFIFSFQSNGESMIDKNGNVWTCIVCGKIAADAKTKVRFLHKKKIFSFLTRYKFPHQANLKRHTETHIKGIPWPCNICGKVSGSKSGLAQHKAKYHKDQESAMVAVKVILVKISIHLFHILSLHIAVLYFSVN